MDDGTLESLRRIPVLHSWINLLKWNENACYYQNAKQFTEQASLEFKNAESEKAEKQMISLHSFETTLNILQRLAICSFHNYVN